MGAAALNYAGKGWKVLPCWPSGNAARPDRAKSPIGSLVPRGFHQATSDPEVIRRWWTAHPDAMIGAVVDPRVVIIDIDPRNGGSVDAIEDLTQCSITNTCTVWSGRGDGGRHLYYWRPDGPLTAHKLPTGVDLKKSGYTIVPPSIHPASGQPYRWAEQRITEVPGPLEKLLHVPLGRPLGFAPTIPGRGPAALVEFVARQTEGNRNKAIYWAARRAIDHGWMTGDLGDELVAAAVAAGEQERRARLTLWSAECAS